MSSVLPDAFLVCERVTLSRNGSPILREISFQARKGERLAIVGGSGAGKTTLLRVLAGMESATGVVLLDGQRVPAYARGDNPVGMVFQRPVIYPHLSVRENLSFPLAARNRPKSQIEARTRHLAEILQLTTLMDRPASLLSGGEMQRVAIGRALAYPPKLLLLDEPFANLHQTLRWQMVDYIRQLHQEDLLTTLLVTHDPGDAMYFADRIAVVAQGRILQLGTVSEITAAPAWLEVAQLLFDPPPNLFPITRLECATEVVAAWKPGDTELEPLREDATRESLKLTGVVRDISRHFDQTVVSLAVADTTIRALTSLEHCPRVGERLALTVEKSKMHYFEKHTGRRLN